MVESHRSFFDGEMRVYATKAKNAMQVSGLLKARAVWKEVL